MIRAAIVVMAVILASCANQEKKATGWEVTVKGKVGYPGEGAIEIQEITDGENGYKDTIQLNSNYTFQKKITITEAGYYRLSFYKKQYVDFILDKSNVEVNVDGNDPRGFVEIKGSPDHDVMMAAQRIFELAQMSPEAVMIEKEFTVVARGGDMERVEELRTAHAEILNKAQDSVVTYLKTQPVSLGMINLMLNNNVPEIDRHFSFYEETAARLKSEWPTNKYAVQFIEMVDRSKKTAIGAEAPEIALPTPKGDTLRLSSLRGKYVLVDFWAKWCGPCRRENPNVVKAYHQFKDSGFDVLGVSLDRTKEDWVQAIQEDGLVWNHVSDLKYFDSQAAATYNINAIPFSILVDPKGVIIAKNLRGPVLHKKLSEIFKKS